MVQIDVKSIFVAEANVAIIKIEFLLSYRQKKKYEKDTGNSIYFNMDIML
jgi:hypothetical protein